MKARSAVLARARKTRRSLIDALESRRLLSLTLFGTSAGDIMRIFVGSNNDIGYTLNGVLTVFGAPSDGVVSVRGGNGTDLIQLITTGSLSFDLSGEAEGDRYEIGTGNLYQQIRRNITLSDTVGNNEMTIDDQVGAGSFYGIDAGSLTLPLALGAPTIQLLRGAGQSNTIRLSDNNDELSVIGIPDNTLIDMRGGLDAVDLGGPNEIVPLDLPDSCTIHAGSGNDVLNVDDSNTNSLRGSLLFDDTGLAGSVNLVDFTSMFIDLHPTILHPESVIFHGTRSFANSISINGNLGPDHVSFGEPGSGVFASQFAANVRLDLREGENVVDIVERPDSAATTWTLTEKTTTLAPDILQAQGGTTYNFINSVPAVARDITLNLVGGNGTDVYSIVDTPDDLRVNIDGAGGNDRLQMGGLNDLDDVFDGVGFSFDGGAGIDEMDLNDVADVLGDLDGYRISDVALSKNDASNSQLVIVSYDQTEKLVLHADADGNEIRFDGSEFDQIEIFGGAGGDTFVDHSSSPTTDVLRTSLATTSIFHGESGTDSLVLNDSEGGQGDYELNATQFFYAANATVNTINFDSISSINLTGSDSANSIFLRARPTGASLIVGAGAGDDTVTLGGGDLDSSGFTSSNVTLGGTTGNDSIIFDDQVDSSNDGTSSAYTLTNNTLTKGGLTLFYGAFDLQTLLVANFAASGQLEVIPVVNLNTVAAGYEQTTIVGGTARGCFVNVATGDLGTIAGVVNINTVSTLTINDANATAATSSYEINSSQVLKTSTGKIINYASVGTITLNTSNFDDTVIVKGVPPGTSVIVNAGNGIDRFTLGNGNVDADLLGPVVLNGGASNNGLTINNTTDPTAESQSMSNTAFVDGLTHTYSGLTSMTHNGGPGGTTLAVNAVSIPQTINGGSGDDTFNLFNGNLANFTTNFILNGGSGNDAMNLLGQNTSSSSICAFPNQTQFRFGDLNTGKIINYSAIERASLQTGTGGDNIDVSVAPFALTIASGAGNDALNFGFFANPVSPFPITVNTGSENTNFGGGDGLTIGSATVVIDQDDAISGLSLSGTLRVTNGAVLTRVPPFIDFLPLNLTGVIDLADGALLWRGGGQTPDFRAMLTNGRSGGAWNGSSASGAVNSSMAASTSSKDGVGYGLGSEIAVGSIGGFAINPGDTLVRYTLDGDADLNGTANFDDLLRLTQNYTSASGTWTKGDFDFDNAVTFPDVLALAQNFNSQAVHAAISASKTPSVRSSRFSQQLIAEYV